MRVQVVMDGRLLTYEVNADGFALLIKNEKYKGPKCPMCGGRGVL